ncbi:MULTISPECIES: acetoacetate decarboxylase family protein [Saccharopolyspora]|uniref:Acetoacetate decarboxylase family protein n=1 Tax=Saccharopolyspora gregorii TaxID=33914 RepID=A0ABP6RP24_9PSEU|nr:MULTISPECIES: acetoacetate decarboxylase family protein [Saccharopolyspora]MCA1186280.1 acetoacetate decarboxylase family protein [Saccharopolyspora sp. 6T]MCA1192201.1 acetoacetate decarboxylase family protein [Saccharopolyspora sp. 6V]MCA1225776.1 acetoacetate decarboxylase family protein [Saccharopolyspora sp. 6M]MCA1280025.1 acetoacetate decarboxylase family protein [Saccharopolyspora sp. 7B]
MTYPPEPWELHGDLHLSLWSLPEVELPGVPLETPPVLIGDRGLVGTAWVRYGPGSVLEYDELLVAVLVRDGAVPRVHISQIWVDSPESLRGGRELWGIPKESAEFRRRTGARVTSCAAGGIASAGFSRLARVPGRWPFAYRVAQDLHEFQQSPVRGSAGLTWCSAVWRFDPDGPLAWLDGRRPVASAALTDFSMSFGAASG